MRFADADVVTQEDGMLPPLEVRLDLQPGDRVGLYEEIRHPSMGAGYSPVEAVILGSPEHGWFIGETEDGREITFHAGNVVDIDMGSPSMGGILDWFKKMAPPTPGALIPSQETRPQLPALPQPPEERKGMIAQLKTIFAAPFPASTEKAAPAAEKRSIFQIFKKQEAPRSGLPVERGPQGIVPSVQTPSMFSVLDPGSKVIMPFVEKAASMVLPEGPGPLAPIIEKALAPFIIIPKSPEPEPYEIRKAKQQEYWAEMFPKAEEGRPPISAMFTMFAPEEIQPREEVIPPELPTRMHRNLKVLPIPRREALLPTVEEIARGLMGFYRPLEELFDTLKNIRSTPKWLEKLQKYGFAKEPFETLGSCGGVPTMFQELSSFLHIPWEEFQNRVQTGNELVDDELVWMEIVFPATELITQAFELMKPSELPGYFAVERAPHGKDFCMLLMTYVEGEEKEGAHAQWQQEQAQNVSRQTRERLSPEEFVAGMKQRDENPQATLAVLEKQIFALMKQREGIEPSEADFDEKVDALTSEIEYWKAIVEEIQEETSEEQEERSPRELAEALTKGIVEEEQSIIKLIEDLEQLDPNNEEFKALSKQLKDNLQESKTNLRNLTEELSNLPIEPKRASPRKKSPKRGKKKGR